MPDQSSLQNLKLPQEQPSLPAHEWLAIVFIISLMAVLCLVAISYRESSLPEVTSEPHYVIDQEIEVFIEGAVENPGTYKVKRGALLQEVLILAKPTTNADLRRIKLQSKVRQGQSVKILTLPMITIHIEGAVNNPGSMTLPKGTRLCDLIEKISFQENADLKKLQKKRKLKDSEVIKVLQINL